MQKEQDTQNVSAWSWREILGMIFRDAKEKQRVADLVGITTTTLDRWVKGEGVPRVANLRRLLQALPAYQEHLRKSMEREFNDLFQLQEVMQEIPSEFLRRIIELIVRSDPVERLEKVTDAAFGHLIYLLDPDRLGCSLVLCVPTPPRSGKSKIRSTHELFHIFNRDPAGVATRQRYVFRGSESLLAQCAFRSNIYSLPISYAEEQNMRCCLISPLLRRSNVAGWLHVFLADPQVYISSLKSVIDTYVQLLSLTFDERDFYPFERLRLRTMPTQSAQEQDIRIEMRYREFLRRHVEQQNLAVADRLARQDLEDMLCALKSDTTKKARKNHATS